MRNLFILLSIFSFIFLNSCKAYVYDSSDNNLYYVVRYNSESSKIDRITVNSVLNTDHLYVYAESGYNYSLQNVRQVVQKFEENYMQMTNIYGAHTDVDNNGKIKLLFVDINVNNSGDSVVMGYFLPNDLIYGSANNGEILYMDINLLNSNPDVIAGTVLHEFQHLINFNVNYLKKGKEMSLWLNECLSESTSVLFDDNIVKSRINEFNNIKYYCFYTWNLPYPYQNYFVNYPSASVFMNWLYIKNNRNSNIFKNIAKSTEIEDYNKVLKSISGGSTWETLLTDWINGVDKNEVPNAKISKYDYSVAYLYPGALIYDGSQVRVNSSTELSSNPAYITVSKANSISGRSAINNDEEEISLQNMENNQKTKYIDLVFDADGKIREY